MNLSVMNELNTYTTLRKTFLYRFRHPAPASTIFPLLCPERQKEWLPNWSFEMKHSESGLIEQDCVFYTATEKDNKDVWVVSYYDLVEKQIEFIRVSPGVCVIKINMMTEAITDHSSETEIIYTYTALTPARAAFLESDMESLLKPSLENWANALNLFVQ